MPYGRYRRSYHRRGVRNRRWLWIRSQANSVAPIVAPAFETIDLLANYRTLAGIDLNLPEFTIWRVRIKISVRLTIPTGANVESNNGVTVAMFVDNMSVLAGLPNPVVAPYDEKFLLWDTMMAYKTISAAGGGTTSAAPHELALYQEYDMKGRRRLGNIGDTLIFQFAPVASGTITNYSYQQNTLVLTK